MTTSGKNCESLQKLNDAWDEVISALSQFSFILRTLDGCEHSVVTLCMRNGSVVDAYSIPSEPKALDAEGNHRFGKLEGRSQVSNENKREMADQWTDRSSDLYMGVSSKACNTQTISEVFGFLKELSNHQVRFFLTEVRCRLKLKNFDWPEAAKNRFMKEMNAPVPTAPGRANSGKEALLHVLRLSAEIDDAWRFSLYKTFEGFRSECLLKQGTPAEDSLPQDSAPILDMIDPHSPVDDSPETDLHMLDPSETEPSHEPLTDMPEHIMEVAKNAPDDTMKVIAPVHAWVSLAVLLSKVRHPGVSNNIEWFIQPIPGDGNCMFSAILVGAKLRRCLCSSLDSVYKMRKRLRRELIGLSKAGNLCSKYRRDWLASCLYEVDHELIQSYCQNHMEEALSSYEERDMEQFLAPLRVMVSNWAGMVGGEHWGGLLRIELSIIASMLQVVIEVMEPLGTNVCTHGTAVPVCDTRFGNDVIRLVRRDLIHPHAANLPSVAEGFLAPVSTVDSSGGWVGPYPVLRVVLNNRHYSACTSRYSFPIAPEGKRIKLIPGDAFFQEKDTLVEPYSSLSREEKEYYTRALEMIRNWREACDISPESGRHADNIVMESRCTTLTVSMLSHLEEPDSVTTSDLRFWISDEIVTCYMYLLQGRTNEIRRRTGGYRDANGFSSPPRSVYMDSWFFNSLWRGLSGPSWKKKRIDLREFDTILIPALVNGHWALAVCYVNEGVIGVYDPFNLPRRDIFNAVQNWVRLQLPGGDKKNWRFQEIREERGCAQIGSIDCGIYVCKAAESLGLGYPLRISQPDICYVRKRMIVELMRQEATNINWSQRVLP